MSPLRWLYIVGVLAAVYVSHVIYAEITGGPALSPRLNMLALAVLTAAFSTAAYTTIQDRRRLHDSDRQEIRDRTMMDAITHLQRHVDRRLDSIANQFVEVEAVTADVSAAASKVRADGARPARPRRRRTRKPLAQAVDEPGLDADVLDIGKRISRRLTQGE